MTGTSIIPQRLIILGIVLPLAALMGYLLATPDDFRTVGLVGAVAGLITLPLLLKWQHPLLIFSWNAAITFAFLPGSLTMWMVMAFASLGVILVNTGMDRSVKLNHVPALTWTLLAFAAVILITAHLNGGMGVRALGGSMFGGKKYFLLLFAIVGYFAMSLQRIPEEKAGLYSGLFILSRTTTIASNLAYFVPALWLLYYVLPTGYAMNQVMAEEEGFYSQTAGSRYAGVGFGLMACSSYLLMRFGVRGLLDGSRPWRFPLFLCIVAFSLVGGFRSVLLGQALLFLVMFTLEGLWRTRTAVALVISSLIGFVLLAVTASHLPMTIQRSLSLLPIEIDPGVQLDAQMSSDWRLRMWKVLFAEIPNYFWLGKGYVANATDYYLLLDSTRRGMSDTFELSLLAGDFHNGPLSVIIPFGIWGVLAFGAFLIAGGRLLRANYRFGRPGLMLVNRFLLAVFWADLIFFMTIFGDLTIDFHRFAGYVALSIGLNGGMATNPADSQSDHRTPIRSKPSGRADRYEKPIRPMRFRA